MVSLTLRTSHQPEPNFLSLPWSTPLESWPDDLAVRLPRGRHRHVVRFIEHDGRYFAFKELPDHLARREYDTLLYLKESDVPVVDLVGVAHSRREATGNALESVLITRHLTYSLPYLHLFAGPQPTEIHQRLIDALVVLLVQVHLSGVYWGDCSLGNTLFRRDAGALVAYLVDTETSELHDKLTAGQRNHDLAIATENIAGGLFELEAMERLPAGIDPVEVTTQLEVRYHELWNELTAEQEIGSDELWHIHQRLARLNQLGFDTTEVEYADTDGHGQVRFRPAVVEEGHHRRRLHQLIGIEAQENQARRLLAAIGAYTSWLSAQEGRQTPIAIGAYRWLSERYRPTIDAIPTESGRKLSEAELYIRVLDHAGQLAQAAGRDVDLGEATQDWVARILPMLPQEHLVLDTE